MLKKTPTQTVKSLKVNVTDYSRARDSLGVYKRWFNGLKYFALRVLPPFK